MKIIISHLHEDIRIGTLAERLENFGKVTSIRIYSEDRKYPFAIAEMPYAHEAQEAIEELDGLEWSGNKLRVKEAEW